MIFEEKVSQFHIYLACLNIHLPSCLNRFLIVKALIRTRGYFRGLLRSLRNFANDRCSTGQWSRHRVVTPLRGGERSLVTVRHGTHTFAQWAGHPLSWSSSAKHKRGRGQQRYISFEEVSQIEATQERWVGKLAISEWSINFGNRKTFFLNVFVKF